MKNTLKLFVTLILALSFVLGAVSCDTLEQIGVTSTEKEQVTETEQDNLANDVDSPSDDPASKDDEDDNDDGEKIPIIDSNFGGGIVYLPNKTDPIKTDPYENVDVDEFYANYTPATSYMDAYYRTKHNLMSGTIAEQDQAPTVSDFQPMIDGKYVRNTAYIYSRNGTTYYVVDSYGNIVKEIYKGGAYIMLDEVAAYVFAFGEPPANHSESKNTSPTASPWGEYLRVNHTVFTGDTYKYPYEPELPDISGCGGDLQYWEMDIGTTGTDCDPSYTATIYNNGKSISRGAARIVYTRSDINRNGIIEVNETYLFYTYNHYNDFQEYLNYSGGWGEIFGNITGGGTISSKYDYNPTPYVEVVHLSLVNADGTSAVKFVSMVMMWIPKREEV